MRKIIYEKNNLRKIIYDQFRSEEDDANVGDQQEALSILETSAIIDSSTGSRTECYEFCIREFDFEIRVMGQFKCEF